MWFTSKLDLFGLTEGFTDVPAAGFDLPRVSSGSALIDFNHNLLCLHSFMYFVLWSCTQATSAPGLIRCDRKAAITICLHVYLCHTVRAINNY